MASAVDWDALLVKKYPSYKIKVEAFLDAAEISSSSEIAAEIMFERIKDEENVSSDLKLIYKKSILGSHKGCKSRINNCIGNFRRNLRWDFYLVWIN